MPKRIEDLNQMDLFGGAPGPRSGRPRRPAAEAPSRVEAAESAPVPAMRPEARLPEATLASLAAAATHPDLEDLIGGLGDEQLSFLAVAALRELRRRAAQPKRRAEGEAPASPQALRRALRRLAEELGGEV